ncbi:unnamed protein product [Periconia digitata]|uniref:Uncharacterized protein n=1 Tax=Periconia digitata TaxID=1303443 RepID=A0A9W4U446_9PLEO|nr:unnamed protein product [Periconia digitata]
MPSDDVKGCTAGAIVVGGCGGDREGKMLCRLYMPRSVSQSRKMKKPPTRRRG